MLSNQEFPNLPKPSCWTQTFDVQSFQMIEKCPAYAEKLRHRGSKSKSQCTYNAATVFHQKEANFPSSWVCCSHTRGQGEGGVASLTTSSNVTMLQTGTFWPSTSQAANFLKFSNGNPNTSNVTMLQHHTNINFKALIIELGWKLWLSPFIFLYLIYLSSVVYDNWALGYSSGVMQLHTASPKKWTKKINVDNAGKENISIRYIN